MTTKSLKEIENKINKHTKKISSLFRKTLVEVKTVGDLLNDAKELVPHGGWEKWLKGNFDPSAETARNYMRVAKNWEEQVLPLLKEKSNISLFEVLNVLRQPQRCVEITKTPPREKLTKNKINSVLTKFIKSLPDDCIGGLYSKLDRVKLLMLELSGCEETEEHLYPHTLSGVSHLPKEEAIQEWTSDEEAA